MSNIGYVITKEELLDRLLELGEIMDEEYNNIREQIDKSFLENKIENGRRIEEYTAFDIDGNFLFDFEIYKDDGSLKSCNLELIDY